MGAQGKQDSLHSRILIIISLHPRHFILKDSSTLQGILKYVSVQVLDKKEKKEPDVNQENLLPSFFFLLTEIIKTSVFPFTGSIPQPEYSQCLGHFHFVIWRIQYINFQDLSQEK